MKLQLIRLTTNRAITPLKADFIINFVAFYLSLTQSDDAARQFLTEMHQAPFFILSDGFPYEYLPMPKALFALPENTEHKTPILNHIIKHRKDLKRMKYIWFEHLKYFDTHINEPDILQDIITKSKSIKYHEVRHMHNRVNRLIGTSSDLFYVQTYSGEFYLLLFILEPEKFQHYKIESALYTLFTEWGYGQKTSIGYGKFTMAITPLDTQTPLNQDHDAFTQFLVGALNSGHFATRTNARYFTLADSIPSPDLDLYNASYNLRKYIGKYSFVSIIKNRHPIYFKKPVLKLAAGATIIPPQEDKVYVGSSVSNIPQIDADIQPSYSFGYTPILYLKSLT